MAVVYVSSHVVRYSPIMMHYVTYAQDLIRRAPIRDAISALKLVWGNRLPDTRAVNSSVINLWQIPQGN